MLSRELYYREAMAIGVFIDDAIGESIAVYVSHSEDEAKRRERERAEIAEETSRRKDEFLAVLGHELRNPLAPIITSARVIRSVIGAAPGPLRQSIEVIERQAAQMSRLVDDMLDLARIGQGRFELRRTRLALAGIIEQAVLGVEPVMKANRHRFTISIPDPALELDADADRLLQIVGNLLNNAAKYTPAGGEIVLAAVQEGPNAVVRVRDNGIGIPAQMLSRVFELFAQVEGAKEYAQGGLGIGLTLVRRLVEQHGGSISCHSDGAGKGSEFVVHLPLVARVHDPSSTDGLGGEAAIRIVRREP